MLGGDLLDMLAKVVPQVPSVGDLDRFHTLLRCYGHDTIDHVVVRSGVIQRVAPGVVLVAQ